MDQNLHDLDAAIHDLAEDLDSNSTTSDTVSDSETSGEKEDPIQDEEIEDTAPQVSQLFISLPFDKRNRLNWARSQLLSLVR